MIEVSIVSTNEPDGSVKTTLHQGPSSSMQVDDQAFLSALQAARNDIDDMMMLPPMVRFVSSTSRVVLFERPPRIQTITYNGLSADKASDATDQVFDIPLPWQLYAFVFDSTFHPMEAYLFALAGPIESYNSSLYRLPLVNIYSQDAKFCLPNATIQTQANTLAQGINGAYDKIWSSTFNKDVMEEINAAWENRLPRILFKEMDKQGEKRADYMTKLRHIVSPATLFAIWQSMSLEDIALSVTKNWIVDHRFGSVGNLVAQLTSNEAQVASPIYMMNTLRNAAFYSTTQ